MLGQGMLSDCMAVKRSIKEALRDGMEGGLQTIYQRAGAGPNTGKHRRGNDVGTSGYVGARVLRALAGLWKGKPLREGCQSIAGKVGRDVLAGRGFRPLEVESGSRECLHLSMLVSEAQEPGV